MFHKFTLPLSALALVGAVAACDKVAPATPESTPGPVAQENSLNGTYNLVASNCGTAATDKSLVIDGNKFIFPESNCTVANSSTEVNRTSVTLSCQGGNSGGNRVILLQQRPGVLKLNEGKNTYTYYQCERADASSNTKVAMEAPASDL